MGTERFLLRRVISDVPLPDPERWEQFEAVLQNAVWNMTGMTGSGAVEKIYFRTLLRSAQADGTRKQRSFLGMARDRLYFDWFAGDGSVGGTESCAADGSDWQAVPGKPGNQRCNWTYTQNGSLRWLTRYLRVGR